MQDNYPIVRYFAANSLAALHPNLPKPDYLAPAPVRAASSQAGIRSGPRNGCKPRARRESGSLRCATKPTSKWANKLASPPSAVFLCRNARSSHAALIRQGWISLAVWIAFRILLEGLNGFRSPAFFSMTPCAAKCSDSPTLTARS